MADKHRNIMILHFKEYLRLGLPMFKYDEGFIRALIYYVDNYPGRKIGNKPFSTLLKLHTKYCYEPNSFMLIQALRKKFPTQKSWDDVYKECEVKFKYEYKQNEHDEQSS